MFMRLYSISRLVFGGVVLVDLSAVFVSLLDSVTIWLIPRNVVH